MGKIKVKGSARMKFQAELLEIEISTKATGSNSGIALKNGKEQLEKILSAMQEKLNISPESFMLEKDTVLQDYNKDSYTFRKTIFITIKADLAVLEEVTDLLTEFADTSYSANFKLDNVSEKEKLVLRKAIEDAKQKANMIAEYSGEVISGLEDINCEYQPFPEITSVVEACRAFSPKLASRLSLPKEEISKEVNVIFLIEPKA